MYRLSHKSRATGTLLFGKKTDKCKEGKVVAKRRFQSQVLDFYITSRHGDTVFILSTIESSGDVATLT
jgi:hypothetical protein